MLTIIFYYFGTVPELPRHGGGVSIGVILVSSMCCAGWWLRLRPFPASSTCGTTAALSTLPSKNGKQRPLHLTVQRPFNLWTIWNALRRGIGAKPGMFSFDTKREPNPFGQRFRRAGATGLGSRPLTGRKGYTGKTEDSRLFGVKIF